MAEQKTCEVIVTNRTFCSKEATMRYPAHGGGYMLLCDSHGEPHARYCEQWDGTRWIPAPSLESSDV